MQLLEGEMATKFVRIYPTDYETLKQKAKVRRTSIGQIIHELLHESK